MCFSEGDSNASTRAGEAGGLAISVCCRCMLIIQHLVGGGGGGDQEFEVITNFGSLRLALAPRDPVFENQTSPPGPLRTHTDQRQRS